MVVEAVEVMAKCSGRSGWYGRLRLWLAVWAVEVVNGGWRLRLWLPVGGQAMAVGGQARPRLRLCLTGLDLL